MTDRWRDVWVFGAFGIAFVLLLNVVAGCDDGDAPAPDAAVADVAAPVDSGGGSDGAGTADAPPAPDAAPPPDASADGAPSD